MRLRIFRRWRRLFLALCCVAAPHMVRAAEPEVLFEDNFATYSPDLGTAGPGTDVIDNVLHIAVPGDSWNRKFYKSKRFTDADATVRVRHPDFTNSQSIRVGLAFWAVDADDFYALSVTESDYCGVFHYCRNYFRQAATFRKIERLKTKPGEWNDFRVVTQGNLATLYVNGRQLVVIKGRPPREGGMIGMYSYAGSKPLVTEFASLKVVRPVGKPPLTPAAEADDVLYAMDPNFPDAGWSPPSDIFGWKDGGFFLQASPKVTNMKLYLADAAPAMDLTAKVRMNDGDDTSVSGVGLDFWAKDKDNLFMFYVSDDGKVQVVHYDNGKWTYHLRTPVPAETKMNLHDWTALHIVTEKDKANFFVNDVKVGMVFEKSPEPESMFGIMSDASAKPCRGEYREIKVRRLSATKPAK